MQNLKELLVPFSKLTHVGKASAKTAGRVVLSPFAAFFCVTAMMARPFVQFIIFAPLIAENTLAPIRNGSPETFADFIFQMKSLHSAEEMRAEVFRMRQTGVNE